MRRAKGVGTVIAVKTPGGIRYRARKREGPRSVYGTLRKSRREAETDLKALEFDEPAPVSEVPTLSDYAKELLTGRFATGHFAWKRTTWQTNEVIWRTKLDPAALGRMKLNDITRRDVQSFVGSLAASPAWTRRIGAFVSRILSEAVRDDLIKNNPCIGVRYPEVPIRENRTLTPEEAIRLLNPTNRLSAMILVAAHTGLRRGELCGLKWEDVEEDRITVRRSLTTVRGGVFETSPKTPESRALVPLTSEAKAALAQQPKRSEYVFTTDSGLPVDPSNLTRDWRTWCDKHGFGSRMRLHDLRGSFISLLLENGADVRAVQELARHADSRTTMRVYARSRMDVKIAAVELLSNAIGENRVQNRVQNPSDQGAEHSPEATRIVAI